MRRRLVHTLSSVMIVVIFTALLAFGGLLAWNLRSGFNDYLLGRDTERLEQFSAVVAEELARAGGVEALSSGQIDMHSLLEAFAGRFHLPSRAPPGGMQPRGMPPRGMALMPPPGLPPAPEGFESRVGIYALDGRLLAGRALAPHASGIIERPVLIGGRTVASVRMLPAPPLPDAIEAAFLRRQFLGIAVLAVSLMALGLVTARQLAGRWVRPLLDMQSATARIARGDFGTRLTVTRSDEIGDLVNNVNQMAEGLQSLEGTRRRWIAEISHELRTPLAVLRAEIEALADGVRPLGMPAVTSLREEVLRLGALVDDLHLLAMADLNALPCHLCECDAVRLVQTACQRFAYRASTQGIMLEMEPPAAPVLPVHWDPQRIEQLLTNLLDNSLRYTDSPGRVRVRVRQEADRVVLSVEDSAPGVPDAELPRLFEPLYRADGQRNRRRDGSGLGLAICSALVRAHGGLIRAAASQLGGLSISVELPLAALPRA